MPPAVAFEKYGPRQEDVIPRGNEMVTKYIIHVPDEKSRRERPDT